MSDYTKRCRKCGQTFPATLEYFYANPQGKYGLRAICKTCYTEYDVKHRVEHADEIRERGKRYRADNPEREKERHAQYRADNQDKIRASNAEYRSTHTEERSDYNAKYHQEHREQISAKVSKWQKENPKRNSDKTIRWRRKHPGYLQSWRRRNPGKAKAMLHRYWSRKRSLPATFTDAHWQHALSYFGNKCVYCGNAGNLTQDHFIPVTKNGGYTPNNILPACGVCNSSKGNRDPIKWLVSRFGDSRADEILACIAAYFDLTELANR